MKTRSIALAGMISDTSLYNVDGACVLTTGSPVAAGTVVGVVSSQPVDGHKVVGVPVSSDVPPYGVAIRSAYEAADGTYKPQEAINVISAGRVWVRTTLSAAPKVGDAMFVDAQGRVVAGPAGSEGAAPYATDWTAAGGFVTAYAGAAPIKQGESIDGALVEVQVKQK